MTKTTFDQKKHQLIMGKILKDIYSDQAISSLLGFKGGTCAYFFYGLPRFSVDLDFDLLRNQEKDQTIVFSKIRKILAKYCQVKNSYIKKNTIFALLSYNEGEKNIKVEISFREWSFEIKKRYRLQKYLGISVLVAREEYLFAGKLSALAMRQKMAMRDVFDTHYFFGKQWDVDQEALVGLAGKNLKELSADCIKVVKIIKDNKLLDGLGELLEKKQKIWVKTKLKEEVLSYLQLTEKYS